MQYNDTSGDLNITDNVVMGATLSVAGNAYLSSGTSLQKKIAAVSVQSVSRDLGISESATITIAAYSAPTFIIIWASANMIAASNDPTYYIRRDISIGATKVGELYTETYALGGGDAIEVYTTCGMTRHLSAAAGDYNPAVTNTITISAAVTNGNSGDFKHNLVVMMG